jgi:glutaredoxin
MLQIVVNDNCPLCKSQMALLDSIGKEYQIIKVGSRAFEECELKDYIEIVPFIMARSLDGQLKYAKQGFHTAEEIKTACIAAKEPFNLNREKKYG